MHTLFAYSSLVIVGALVIGWIMNVIHLLVNFSAWAGTSAELGLRLLGIPLPLLGGIMGWL